MDQYIGRLLDDRYEILECIGTGGMAVVYKARCHRLNRLVAIKILKDEFAKDEEFRRRFRAEGEAVAMLSSPNIVQVYDVSSSERANFIVMELIDGISLKQYMEKKGVLNWKENLHFAMQIAAGLEHAHSRGIIHRDIKPHNVMVLKNGSVKVTDFGIARVMSKSNTLTKEALGSVHYISPEQAKGSFTDNRSDLYSLSVVMYEMSTGRPPYDGESPVAVAIQHINGGAVRPSALNPGIPLGLEQIIQKGMALEASDRYSSAAEMLRDMEQLRQDPGTVFDYQPPREDLSRAKIPVPAPVRPVKQPALRKSGDKHPAESASREGEASHRFRKPERYRREHSRMVTASVITVSIVAIVAIVLFLLALFNGFQLNQERELVEVPYLVGELYSENLAFRYSDLNFRVDSREYSSIYEQGEIIRQEPTGSSKVVRGGEVVLVVSLGPEPQESVMENLIGVTQEEAKAFLENQGFHPLFRYETSYIYAADQVTRTDPAYGDKLTQGQTVQLWVSTGPEMIFGIMPNVVGMDKDTALRWLEQLGFANVRIREVKSKEPAGMVLVQSAEAEKEIDINTDIVLEVSMKQGDELEPEEETQQVLISQFVTFELPIREESYELTIFAGGIMVLEPNVIEPGTLRLTLELKGQGTVTYELYMNEERFDTVTVEFAQ